MEFYLSPSWKLTTEHAASSYGLPVLVGPSGAALGPLDIVEAYTSWGHMPARRVLERLVRPLRLTADQAALVAAFLAQGRPRPRQPLAPS